MSTIGKIFGFVLLLLGLTIIIWTLYSSYNIFMKGAEMPTIFETEEKVPTPQFGGQDIQSQIEKLMGEQLKGLLPADSIPKILNLAAWSILAGILIFGGAQIGGLGIKLIK